MNKSYLEESFVLMLKHYGLPLPDEHEYRFTPPRRWRFDLVWHTNMLAVEIEGVSWASTRHQRLDGFMNDCEKYERAMLDGWTVYRVPGPWIAKRVKDRLGNYYVKHIWREQLVDSMRVMLLS